MDEIVILSGARTAIGTFGGSLAGTPLNEIATHVTKAALERAGVEGGQIGTVVFGHVINTEPRDAYLSRVAAIEAGIPDTDAGDERQPPLRLGRAGGRLGGAGAGLGDATSRSPAARRSMSRMPYIVPAARFGQKMGDAAALDMMLGALTCPFGTGHMGVTAENVAAEHQISRAEQDAFALESQTRAAAPSPRGGSRTRSCRSRC
jgi:acetyl-CoA C-acetyltransferase